ncbi:MAG: ABC transporter permease subunit [Oscillospiraceae bacterium]|jgi:NitT/TauT family transport system permease protein|nr:ABC transporter permease subunit [Oscillospiraceae bacterium]
MKRILKRLFIVPNALFIALLLIQLLPDKAYRIEDRPVYTAALAIALELILLAASFLVKQDRIRHIFTDVLGLIFVFLIFWVLATIKFDLPGSAKQAVFPPPGAVLEKFTLDLSQTLVNIRDSLALIFHGYLLAAAAAIPLGLFLGWNMRIGAAAGYISKFLSSISPIVYIPYAIVLLPTFRAASVFVIVAASFWPILASTMSGVLNVEKRIIDSAKTLCVGGFTMLFRIILPAALPQIFIGCNQGLSVSFILLVSAEMIGARSGLGYYVNNYANFGNYTSALAGVITIGIVVTVITFLFNLLQRFLLRWKQ